MYARLISFSVGADTRGQMLQRIRQTVLPKLREFDGFAGYLFLFDEQNQRARAVLLWESEETAEAAERELAEWRSQMTSQMGVTVESADLYEVPIVELEGARV